MRHAFATDAVRAVAYRLTHAVLAAYDAQMLMVVVAIILESQLRRNVPPNARHVPSASEVWRVPEHGGLQVSSMQGQGSPAATPAACARGSPPARHRRQCSYWHAHPTCCPPTHRVRRPSSAAPQLAINRGGGGARRGVRRGKFEGIRHAHSERGRHAPPIRRSGMCASGGGGAPGRYARTYARPAPRSRHRPMGGTAAGTSPRTSCR